MRRRLAIVALGLALVGAAPASARELSFLRVGKPMPDTEVLRIVDSSKRTVLLRGVNVNGLVDYWDADPSAPPPPEKLRPPYPIDPERYAGGRCPPNNDRVEGVALCRSDFGQMRGLGYNVVRLNLSWSLLEPQPGKIDARYMDRVAQVVGWAKERGIYVVLDLHQTAWSKYVYTHGHSCPGEFKRVRGFAGAPLWASRHSWPACAADGDPEVDPAAAEQFQKFWTNADGLQDHYTSVLVALAQRFRDEPAVAGYELMNEPQVGGASLAGTRRMLAYWGRAINAVVAQVGDFRQLFFVEPNVERTEADSRDAPLPPWIQYSSYRHVVYAPHIYRRFVNPGQKVASERFEPMVLGYQAVQDDARALGLPLWIGAFGTAPDDEFPELAEHYTAQDYYKLGGALLSWKENDVAPGDPWGVFRGPFGPGVAQVNRTLLSARATPLVTAGNLQNVSYGPRKKRFDIRGLSGATIPCGDRAHATIVFVPNGVKFRVRHARMKAFKRAGGHDVYVYPVGGAPYRIYSGSGRKRTCPKS